MSDLRFDPVSGTWIAIARNRLERPSEFTPSEQVHQNLICPFCIGNEEQTPASIAVYGENGAEQPLDSSEWKVRVFPNKYPSFSHQSDVRVESGPYGSSIANGMQELIIPSARHITSLAELTDDELKTTFLACQQRIACMKSDESIKHAMLFMNCKAAAGASLGHIHLQLIGSPVVSSHLQDRVDRNQASVRENGQPWVSKLARWEVKQEIRMIRQSEQFDVFCPFASRFPFQIWIVPRQNRVSFVDCSADLRDAMALEIRESIRTLEEIADHPPYNLLLHQAPFHDSEYDHWYIELFPRLTSAAGLELGTDVWVNPISPEMAAKRLRR